MRPLMFCNMQVRWAAEDTDDKLLRDALATLERSGWPVSSEVYALARIPEPETLPTLLPEGLQGIRTLGQWTQRTMTADDARVVIHPRRSGLAAALRGLSRPPST